MHRSKGIIDNTKNKITPTATSTSSGIVISSSGATYNLLASLYNLVVSFTIIPKKQRQKDNIDLRRWWKTTIKRKKWYNVSVII
jgi:hypothetical protein